MRIDHIHFYVNSAVRWRDWFIQKMGFKSIARSIDRFTHREIVSNGGGIEHRDNVIFVLSSPLDPRSKVGEYLNKYPDGVVDVAFRVKNLKEFINSDRDNLEIKRFDFNRGCITIATIVNSVGFKHSLIQREGITPLLPLPNLEEYPVSFQKSGIIGIDHVVLNVRAGELENTAGWYADKLGFERKQNFKIETARSGLLSRVMLHPENNLQIPINEPEGANSQIQEFLDLNKRAGIQHIALKTENIIRSTGSIRSTGLEFLSVPDEYYLELERKNIPANFSESEWRAIREQEILIDFETGKVGDARHPSLLQIFTKPIFDRPTFFFELIERRNAAKGFGEGNFRALFEAIEREQMKRAILELNYG